MLMKDQDWQDILQNAISFKIEMRSNLLRDNLFGFSI